MKLYKKFPSAVLCKNEIYAVFSDLDGRNIVFQSKRRVRKMRILR